MNTLKRIEAVLLKNLGSDDKEVSEHTIIRDLPGYSSMGFIRFIVAIEKEFKVHLDTRTLLEVESVGDLIMKVENPK